MDITRWSDVLRLVAFCAAFVTFGANLGVLWRARVTDMSAWQVFRFLGATTFVTQVLITEMTRIHHIATWHTWFDATGSVLSAIGSSELVRRMIRAKGGQNASSRLPHP